MLITQQLRLKRLVHGVMELLLVHLVGGAHLGGCPQYVDDSRGHGLDEVGLNDGCGGLPLRKRIELLCKDCSHQLGQRAIDGQLLFVLVINRRVDDPLQLDLKPSEKSVERVRANDW